MNTVIPIRARVTVSMSLSSFVGSKIAMKGQDKGMMGNGRQILPCKQQVSEAR